MANSKDFLKGIVARILNSGHCIRRWAVGRILTLILIITITLENITQETENKTTTATRPRAWSTCTKCTPWEREAITSIIGCYQVDTSLYPNTTNQWHFVTVSWKDDKKNFVWKNRAGISWTLEPIPIGDAWNLTHTEVGPDCPFFNDGYEFARALTWEGAPGESGRQFNRPYGSEKIQLKRRHR